MDSRDVTAPSDRASSEGSQRHCGTTGSQQEADGCQGAVDDRRRSSCSLQKASDGILQTSNGLLVLPQVVGNALPAIAPMHSPPVMAVPRSKSHSGRRGGKGTPDDMHTMFGPISGTFQNFMQQQVIAAQNLRSQHSSEGLAGTTLTTDNGSRERTSAQCGATEVGVAGQATGRAALECPSMPGAFKSGGGASLKGDRAAEGGLQHGPQSGGLACSGAFQPYKPSPAVQERVEGMKRAMSASRLDGASLCHTPVERKYNIQVLMR